MKKIMILALAAVSAGANAFVISGAGPYISDGPVGFATNGHLLGSNGGGATLIGSITVTGDLTTGGVGSFLTEARLAIKNTTNASAVNVQPFATGGTWTGTASANRTFGALLWVGAGDNYDIETFESFNDAGTDATWNNLNVSFNNFSGLMDYGTYAAGTSFTLDTEGGNFDTELALYSSSGLMIANDDDSGTGTLSLINAGVLAQGDYYVVSGGFNSTFVNYAAGAGTATGNMSVNVNGVNKFAGAHAAGTFEVGVIHVVPEPASMIALGAGALALIRRRRSK